MEGLEVVECAVRSEQRESCLADRASLSMSLPTPGRSDFTYTSCYCEENVYLLCRSLVARGIAHLDDLAVVFISNPDRKVPLWCQKAGMRREGGSGSGNNGEEQGLVVWDYHVICVHLKHSHGTGRGNRAVSAENGRPEWFVWDLDTILTFPTPAAEYIKRALWAGRNYFLPLQETYPRLYRVVSASNYFRFFASDRSHMRDSTTNDWLASPPNYPCISAEDGETNRLETYIRMSAANNVDIEEACKDYRHAINGHSTAALDFDSWKTLLAAHNFGVPLDEDSFCLLLGLG